MAHQIWKDGRWPGRARYRPPVVPCVTRTGSSGSTPPMRAGDVVPQRAPVGWPVRVALPIQPLARFHFPQSGGKTHICHPLFSFVILVDGLVRVLDNMAPSLLLENPGCCLIPLSGAEADADDTSGQLRMFLDVASSVLLALTQMSVSLFPSASFACSYFCCTLKPLASLPPTTWCLCSALLLPPPMLNIWSYRDSLG